MPAVNYYHKYNFRVMIDGITRAAFKTCSEIKVEVEDVNVNEGGALLPHKEPGRADCPDVTLTRGETQDRDMYDYMRRTLDMGVGTGENANDLMGSVEIVQMDRDGTDVRRWVLYDAYCKSFSSGDWNNDESAAKDVSIVIRYHHFKMFNV